MTASDHSDEGNCGFAEPASVDAPAASLLEPVARTPGPTVPRADFLARIDQCVRCLAAWLGAGADLPDEAADAERASGELWRWLHADRAVLDDGTPITFPVFDNALQRVVERLPRRGLPGQEHLMRAAWLLAEATHAPMRAPLAGCLPSPALP